MTGEPDDSPPRRVAATRPRVIFGRGGTDRPAPASREPRPSNPFGAADTAPARREGPRVVAGGQVRRRVPCTAVDLMLLDAGAFETVVEAGARIVEGINLDDGGGALRRFGAGLQDRHAALAEEALAASDDGASDSVRDCLARTIAHLRALDPDILFGPRDGGFLDALRSLAAPPSDPAAAFGEGYPALRASADALREALRRLDASAARLRDLAARGDRLDADLHAHVLAARFLVRHVRNDTTAGDARWSAANALEARLPSLEATRATLATGRASLAAAAASAESLADAASGVLDVDLPAWHTAYAAALAAVRSARPDIGASLVALRAAHRRTLGRLDRERPP